MTHKLEGVPVYCRLLPVKRQYRIEHLTQKKVKQDPKKIKKINGLETPQNKKKNTKKKKKKGEKKKKKKKKNKKKKKTLKKKRRRRKKIKYYERIWSF
jgi:hypothetical protein